jgi:hypothetical protein
VEAPKAALCESPWATLFEAVYRSKIPKPRVTEALSYLDQSEEYFNAGTQVGGRMSVKPVLLYYSVLNLAKSLLAVRMPTINLSHAYHGISAARTGKWALLGDEIKIKKSSSNVNIFGEVMNVLEGTILSLRSVKVRDLLPQILPAHRLWTYASDKNEQFLSVEIMPLHDQGSQEAWLVFRLDKGELAHVGKTVTGLIQSSGLPGSWEQVRTDSLGTVLIEQVSSIVYGHRPLDCVHELFNQVRAVLWCVVTSIYPHRKYYLNTNVKLGVRRLPQWASVYLLFYYLSDITRYRPDHFDRFLQGRYGPQIEAILDECPRQFLYLMASELLQREVAPAAIA